jgi:hypothetical protein
VRNMQWADQSEAHANTVVQQLRTFIGDKQEFPTMTLESLEALNVFASAEVRFLHDRRVVFTPVSGGDPDDKVFLAVRLESGFLTPAGTISYTRGELRPRR